MLQFKQIGCLLLCAVLFALAGCSSAEDVVAENNRYKIVQENDACYLVLKEAAELPDVTGSIEVPYVTFHSFSEMKNDIHSGNFTDLEWEKIEMLSYRKNGKLQLCDLDTLYEPVLPETFDGYIINWFGPRYSFEMINEYGARCTLALLTKSGFEDSINDLQNWEAYISAEYSASQISTESDTERNATVYYWNAWYGKIKNVIYTIEQNGNIYYILEQYELDKHPGISHHVEIYGVSAGQYFEVMCSISERPSIEWLSSFGLRPYVEDAEKS